MSGSEQENEHDSMWDRIMHAENDLQNQLIKCGARKTHNPV